ncbi:MAG: hypothetical protein MH204_06165 [Fimbriimonadaceae bacterium]|nr:hypothetical protein [Fimbriimonadaceae bacterium]
MRAGLLVVCAVCGSALFAGCGGSAPQSREESARDILKPTDLEAMTPEMRSRVPANGLGPAPGTSGAPGATPGAPATPPPGGLR